MSPTRAGDLWEQNRVLFAGQLQRRAIAHSRPVRAVRLSGVELAAPSCSPPEGIWI